MENFDEMIKIASERKKARNDAFKEVSSHKLYEVAKKKISTTMIGALDSIEKKFGFLWSGEKLSKEQSEMKLLFDELRREILDRGNTQIRNLQAEFANYEIVYKKYYTYIPFRKGEDKNANRSE